MKPVKCCLKEEFFNVQMKDLAYRLPKLSDEAERYHTTTWWSCTSHKYKTRYGVRKSSIFIVSKRPVESILWCRGWTWFIYLMLLVKWQTNVTALITVPMSWRPRKWWNMTETCTWRCSRSTIHKWLKFVKHFLKLSILTHSREEGR